MTPTEPLATELHPPDTTTAPEDRLVEATAPPVELDGPEGMYALADYDEGQAEEALGEWTIGDLDSATWAARKRDRLYTRREYYKRIAKDQKSRIDAWLEGESRHIERDLAFFDARLRAFHQAVLDADPKAKTIKLPDGSELTSLAGKLAVEVTDVAAFVAWAEVHECAEELLRYVEPEPQKNEIGKRFGGKAAGENDAGEYPAVDPETGEIVPGIAIARRARSFAVKGPADGDPADRIVST